jgi:hypothetical protein
MSRTACLDRKMSAATIRRATAEDAEVLGISFQNKSARPQFLKSRPRPSQCAADNPLWLALGLSRAQTCMWRCRPPHLPAEPCRHRRERLVLSWRFLWACRVLVWAACVALESVLRRSPRGLPDSAAADFGSLSSAISPIEIMATLIAISITPAPIISPRSRDTERRPPASRRWARPG